MQNKKLIYIILFFLIFLSVALGFIIFSLNKKNGINVTFLDVGQGDAILIEEGSNQVLIDGGRNGQIILEKLGEVMPFWDRKIEAIVATHPDTDHYGGLIEVLDNYEVMSIIKTDSSKDSKEWRVFEQKIKAEKAENITAIYGLIIKFPNGASLQTVYPFTKVGESRDSNADSVVMKLTFGENSFLFTGDITSQVEKKLADSGIDIDVDVLKIAHHGSKSSSSDIFLEKTTPEDAIISVGVKNTYKHPHKEVLDKLKTKSIRIWRTDEEGSIYYICKNEKEKCEAYSK